MYDRIQSPELKCPFCGGDIPEVQTDDLGGDGTTYTPGMDRIPERIAKRLRYITGRAVHTHQVIEVPETRFTDMGHIEVMAHIEVRIPISPQGDIATDGWEVDQKLGIHTHVKLEVKEGRVWRALEDSPRWSL